MLIILFFVIIVSSKTCHEYQRNYDDFFIRFTYNDSIESIETQYFANSRLISNQSDDCVEINYLFDKIYSADNNDTIEFFLEGQTDIFAGFVCHKSCNFVVKCDEIDRGKLKSDVINIYFQSRNNESFTFNISSTFKHCQYTENEIFYMWFFPILGIGLILLFISLSLILCSPRVQTIELENDQ